MRWSGFTGINYGYKKVRTFLPLSLRRSADKMLYPQIITIGEITKIERLGASVGLKKSEILAATNLPIDNMDSIGRGKVTLFGLVVSIIIVVCISFGISLLLNNFHFFDPTPTFTYTPGTRYGSINPSNFRNRA